MPLQLYGPINCQNQSASFLAEQKTFYNKFATADRGLSPFQKTILRLVAVVNGPRFQWFCHHQGLERFTIGNLMALPACLIALTCPTVPLNFAILLPTMNGFPVDFF
jgi:hypothetical protein